MIAQRYRYSEAFLASWEKKYQALFKSGNMLNRAVSAYQNIGKVSHTISGYRNTLKSKFENF